MTARDDPTRVEVRNAAYVAVARQLRENGYSPVPLCNKRPTISGWPAIFCERVPSLEEIEGEWAAGRRGQHEMDGIGIAAAGGLTIIDIDDDTAVVRVLAIVTQARIAPACVGQRGRKIFVRAADGKNVRERNITGAQTAGALEILAWHREGVVPPTVHPKTGRPYIWIDERVTLLTVPLQDLPTITDADVDALRAAFATADSRAISRKKPEPLHRRVSASKTMAPATGDGPPDSWWETSPNRAKIEELVRLFGIVHRAARNRGGRITLRAEGLDAAGKPHRPETIDIDDTQHWKHVVRVIVDELGNTQEGYWLHVEVSRGNAMLGLPGGPATYEEVSNRKFFDAVVDARTFAERSGKSPRTLRTLYWWARMVQGRPPVPPRERRKALVKIVHQAIARLRAAGVEPNIAAARYRAVLLFRAGSSRFAIISAVLEGIARGRGMMRLPPIAEVAAAHGVSVRAVQSALTAAEDAGILVRTRGNEGGKMIILTVPTVVDRVTAGNSLNKKRSPSLHRGGGSDKHGGAEVETVPATGKRTSDPDARRVRPKTEPTPAPVGTIRQPVTAEEQHAFEDFVEATRRGRATEEAFLRAAILPPEASGILLQIVDQNRAGKTAGSKWLRHIASEIGELVLHEPEHWRWQLQGALDRVADRRKGMKGRETPVKWARTFAENVGFIHERAGRLTPMARSARLARSRRECARAAKREAKEKPRTDAPET